LLTAPFAAFALAATYAGRPFTAKHILGTAALLTLCGASLFWGIRRRVVAEKPSPLHDTAEWRPSHHGEEQSGVIGETTTEQTSSRPAQTITVTRADLADRVELSSPRYPGQFKAALTFGIIALGAFVVVVCLLAGQIRRMGLITPFGLCLGALLVVLPATLSFHVALTRVHVQIAADGCCVTLRRGLLGSTQWRWERDAIRSIELACSATDHPVDLVVVADVHSPTIRIAGLDIAEVNTLLLTGTEAAKAAQLRA
jgi:hypothetical protein